MGAVWIVLAFSLVFHLVVIPASWWFGAMIMVVILAYPLAIISAAWEDELSDLFSASIAAITSPSYIRRHMKAFRSRYPSIVVRVCTFAVQEYRQLVASQRERALGIDSKWTTKRQAIAGAEDGATRAIAYWTERLRLEPGIPGARERVEAATAHSRKLQSALDSLDRHIDAVRTGFLECREKVDAMERRIDDVAQIRQLGALPHTSGGGQALADESVRAIAEELVEEAESVGSALADLKRLAFAPASKVAGEDVEQLAEEVVTESEEANRAIEGVGATGADEAQDRTPPQSKSPETPAEPEPGVVERPDAPPKREAQSSAQPWPDPTERIAELKRQRIAREAESEQREQGIGAESGQRERVHEQRMQEIRARSEQRKRDYEQRQREIQAEFEQREREIQAEFEQRQREIEAESEQRGRETQAEFDRLRREIQADTEQQEREYEQRQEETRAGFEGLRQQVLAETVRRRQEILTESLRRRQEILARHSSAPAPEESASPETPSEADSGVVATPEAIDTLDPTPEDHPQAPAPAPSRSTSAQTPATIGETQEERQMKELVGMLRRMADLQDRRAHDLRFRDEFNWEADDREELAQKMTELADDIEMFQGLAKRMKDMESGNSGT